VTALGDLFRSLSGGFARFLYAWVIPSALTVVAIRAVLIPVATASGPAINAVRAVELSSVTEALALAGVVLALSTIFGLLATPFYRLLEGYHLPRDMERWMRRRQRRRRQRLTRDVYRTSASSVARGKAVEQLNLYPVDEDDIMPTRLGNAFKAAETYGQAHYGLDSQLLWYELVALAPEPFRQDLEESRSPIDFFIAILAHLLLLAVASLGIAVWTHSWFCLFAALVALGLIPAAYHGALKNMDEYRSAIQALVNVVRLDLIKKLGLKTPENAKQEVAIWSGLNQFINPTAGIELQAMQDLNEYRAQPAPVAVDVKA
jgi:hypothetical protein